MEIKEEFCIKLQEQQSKVSNHDTLIELGGPNLKVGSDNADFERNIAKHLYQK